MTFLKEMMQLIAKSKAGEEGWCECSPYIGNLFKQCKPSATYILVKEEDNKVYVKLTEVSKYY